jgi:homoserine dehydrogenase
MGGTVDAHRFVTTALRGGQHVVTANKALLAQHWDELFALSRKHHAELYLEASVGGGIPLIQAVHDGLAANRIQRVEGILNGTTNFVLTAMESRGMSFVDALRQAQELGYAEADASSDIDGHDLAQKLAILASIVFRQRVRPEDVHRRPLSLVTREDQVLVGQEFGGRIKYLGVAERTKLGPLGLRAEPTIVPMHHPLATVDGAYNAVILHGDYAARTMLYGQGAGGRPTASAVMSDVIYVARNVAQGVAGSVPSVFQAETADLVFATPPAEREAVWYLRLAWPSTVGLKELSQVTSELSAAGVDLAKLVKRDRTMVLQTAPATVDQAVHRCVGHLQQAFNGLETTVLPWLGETAPA